MAAVASVGSTQDPKWPTCPALKKLPSTPAELFEALGGTIEHATDTRYGWPWPGYTSWRDAGERLSHFRKCVDTEWTDFNDSAGNEGIMSASGHADKALVENLMNGFDAKLEHLASEYLNGEPGKTMPGSPFEAVKMWSGGYSPDMLPSMTDRQIADLAKSSLLVRLFADPKTTSKNQKEDSRCIVDIRDYGCGIAPEDFRKTICSLNRSGPTSKKHKPWVSGKHGQGAGGTYQYSQLSLIASRTWNSDIVAFTVVSRQWDRDVKTPTFKYLTMGGKVLTFNVNDVDFNFPPGLLMRHIGYQGEQLVAKGGAGSLLSLIGRALPTPLFPVRFEHHIMQISDNEGSKRGPGYSWNQNVYGSVNRANRAAHRTSNPDPDLPRKAQEFRPTYSTQEIIQLGDYDFGGMTEVGMVGMAPAGYVTMTAWAIDPRLYTCKDCGTDWKGAPCVGPEGKGCGGLVSVHSDNESSSDVLKMYVNPQKPILFGLDGQTHDEEYQYHITSESKGAGLCRIGPYMFVHIDCNGLTREARYELFSSLRETTKKTPIQARIMAEVVDRLKYTPKFQELDDLLAVQIKNDAKQDADFAKNFDQYCSRNDIPLDFLTVPRKVGWREVLEKQLGNREKKVKGPPIPIPTREPPERLKWAFKGLLPVKMYPGQTYSWVLETDAHPDYWQPHDPSHSKIRITTIGIKDRGGDTKIVGGRLLCRFLCPKDAEIGSKSLILATCPSANLSDELSVIVVEKPVDSKPPGGENKSLVRGTADPTSKNYVMVRVRRRGVVVDKMPIVRPVAVTRKEPVGQWSHLEWENSDEAGLSVRADKDVGVRIYYNAELPNYLKFGEKFEKEGAAEMFRQVYECKLVMYAIFHLNHEVVMEDSTLDDERKAELRTLFTSVADDLAYEAHREVVRDLKEAKDALKHVSG